MDLTSSSDPEGQAQSSHQGKPAKQHKAERESGCANVWADETFHFVSIQHPEDAKDRDKRRAARSHAVKHALQSRRRLQQASSQSGDADASGRIAQQPASFIIRPGPGYTAYETLLGDSPRLRALLSPDIAKQATEPVFSVADPVIFQDFSSVFRTDLDDPALLNAVKLTFAFAVTGGNIDSECLDFQNQAMSIIRERMSAPETAITLPTLGAILLLAGIEARLGMRWQVQLHMDAIRRLLDVGQSKTVYLTDGIKRAIFWQDLNASVMTGSERIVDHMTFAELQWSRDPFVSSFFTLPPGFERMAGEFQDDFIEVLKDIHALQCVQDLPDYHCQNAIEMLRIDNQQASIGSRLVGLPKLSPPIEACYFASYLSACMLCSKVWRHSVMPSHVSMHLLRKLEESEDDGFWDRHPDLLLWMLYLGGAFSPSGDIRSGYQSRVEALRGAGLEELDPGSFDELLETMREFFWSEKAFRAQVEKFWRETSPSEQTG